MKRAALKAMIGAAADTAGCHPNSRAKLVRAADRTDRIAIGTFETRVLGEKCGCPATVAGYFRPFDAAHPNRKDGWIPSTPEEVRGFPRHFDRMFRGENAYALGVLHDSETDDDYIEVTD